MKLSDFLRLFHGLNPETEEVDLGPPDICKSASIGGIVRFKQSPDDTKGILRICDHNVSYKSEYLLPLHPPTIPAPATITTAPLTTAPLITTTPIQ